jgi:Protein of unknown function (DUF3795)
MTTEFPKKMHAIRMTSIAPCGMNCHLCRAFRPDKPYIKSCPGCRGDDAVKSKGCLSCRIKNCEKIVQGGIKYCFNCNSYPCRRLKDLDKRYKGRYGMSMIDNLESIKKFGIRQFIRTESDKWTCPRCGALICVHKPQCLSCGFEWH